MATSSPDFSNLSDRYSRYFAGTNPFEIPVQRFQKEATLEEVVQHRGGVYFHSRKSLEQLDPDKKKYLEQLYGHFGFRKNSLGGLNLIETTAKFNNPLKVNTTPFHSVNKGTKFQPIISDGGNVHRTMQMLFGEQGVKDITNIHYEVKKLPTQRKLLAELPDRIATQEKWLQEYPNHLAKAEKIDSEFPPESPEYSLASRTKKEYQFTVDELAKNKETLTSLPNDMHKTQSGIERTFGRYGANRKDIARMTARMNPADDFVPWNLLANRGARKVGYDGIVATTTNRYARQIPNEIIALESWRDQSIKPNRRMRQFATEKTNPNLIKPQKPIGPQKATKIRPSILQAPQKLEVAHTVVKHSMKAGTSTTSIGWVSKLASGAKRMRSLL